MDGRPRCYREWEFWISVALTAIIFVSRINDIPLHGEETRRGLIAHEMVETGDWIVPRQQGLPALFRPPLHNWAIALAAWLHGRYDEFAVRLPSVAAIVLVVGIVYCFGRRFLSRLAALAAALCMATMLHVLQYGWLGETEAFYVLVVSGSMLAWRMLDTSDRPKWMAWCAGYALAAAGMLTKGPQSPMLFVGGVGLFLLIERRWRELFTWQHAAGIATFVGLYAAWAVPFYLRVGPECSWAMLTADVNARFADKGPWNFFRHLLLYPVEIALCILPWGLLLLAFARRSVRSLEGMVRTEALFLACCVLIGFASCWVVPGARNRYFAPVHPCLALLVGLAVDRLAVEHAARQLFWRLLFLPALVFIAVMSTWAVGATLLGYSAKVGSQPPLFAACYGAAALLAAAMIWRVAKSDDSLRRGVAMLAVAMFFALTYTGGIINTFAAVRRSMADEVAQLRNKIPAGTCLVSIGEVVHNFAFYYGATIPEFIDEASAMNDPDWTYFCINDGPQRAKCDFPYTVVGRVPCDPNSDIDTRYYVLVGRREPHEFASKAGQARSPR